MKLNDGYEQQNDDDDFGQKTMPVKVEYIVEDKYMAFTVDLEDQQDQ